MNERSGEYPDLAQVVDKGMMTGRDELNLLPLKLRVFFHTQENIFFECYRDKSRKPVDAETVQALTMSRQESVAIISESSLELLKSFIESSNHHKYHFLSKSALELYRDYGLIEEDQYRKALSALGL